MSPTRHFEGPRKKIQLQKDLDDAKGILKLKVWH